ncbi:MAG: spore cortex biosynthesis protein YabQ [Christensenellales bacterium]|jgi:hypothetical protein
MHQTAENHIAIFLTMLYGGLLSGALYGFIKFLKRIVKAGKIASAAADIVYWVLAAALFFVFLLLASGGRLQWFAFAGYALGCGLWRLLVSPVLASIFPRKDKPPEE